MNVTLIYAMLAYSSIKQKDFSGVYNDVCTIIAICLQSKMQCFYFTSCIDNGKQTGPLCSCMETILLIFSLPYSLVGMILKYFPNIRIITQFTPTGRYLLFSYWVHFQYSQPNSVWCPLQKHVLVGKKREYVHVGRKLLLFFQYHQVPSLLWKCFAKTKSWLWQ